MQVLAHYAAIREAQLIALKKRREAAIALEPALEAILKEEAVLRARRGLLLLSQDADSAQTILEDEKKLRELAIQKSELLAAHGLPLDELELRHSCALCKDTGYADGKPCVCLQQKLFEQSAKASNLTALECETFEAFDLSVFPEENGQREGAKKLRELCLSYADEFPRTKVRNMLLFGSVGVGKSFLLNCVASRVLKRGFSVRRLSAYQFVQLAMDMVRGGDPASLRELEHVDLLLLDDLGTEPQIKNITAEQLFAVLDERLQAKRHTLFATNLTPAQLTERYGERMVSRMLDTQATFCARMAGKDLRICGQRK